jgi:2-haloacid dehalogenase
MTPPKAVVFDLGKVLLDFDYGIAVARIQQRSQMSLPDLHSLIDQSPLLYRYETNLLSTPQFFAEVQSSCGFGGSFEEFRAMFSDIFSPIEPMIRLHQELRSNRIPTFIFSNTNELAVGHIRERFPFFANFDGYILSYQHNAMKPDARLYEVVEQVSRRRGAELLYIDDRAENVAAGQARGWRSILHLNPGQTRSAIQEAGLVPPEGSGASQLPCKSASRE